MREALAVAKQFVIDGRPDQAREGLAAAFTPDTDFAVLARAAKWAESVEWPGLRPFKAAFLGGGTLDQVIDHLKFWLVLEGFRLEPYVAPYDTWQMEIVNPSSSLYAFKPEFVWLFTNHRDYQLNPRPEAGWDEAAEKADGVALDTYAWWQAIWSRLPGTQILQNNLEPPQERVFGHLEATLAGSKANLIRLINQSLARKAMTAGVKIFDLEYLASFFGLKNWHNPSYWFHSKHTFAPGLTGQVAYQAAKTLAAALGGAKKVIVLDLDNTLWGGVVGDDGLEGIKLGNDADGEAFAAFQAYLKSLAARGIVLAVSSKNEEAANEQLYYSYFLGDDARWNVSNSCGIDTRE